MTRFVDLQSIEVEHLVGIVSGKPLVKLRAAATGASDELVVALGEVEPDTARKIALDILTAAARAEYDLDVLDGCRSVDMPTDAAAKILHLVRAGEARRLGGA